MQTRSERLLRRRRGNIVVFSAFLMVMMIAMIAFAVDLGYLVSARTELQRSADAAALAGTLDLVNRFNGTTATQRVATSRTATSTYAGYNTVTGGTPSIDTSLDVQVGYVPDPATLATRSPEDLTSTETDTSRVDYFNTVLVKVRKSATWNGRVPYFFARVWGLNEAPDTYTVATAALPPPGPSDVLPFALDKETWDDLMANPGNWPDQFHIQGNTVSSGTDGVHEVDLYPEGTGAPGNRGTVDFGSAGNNTNDIKRQIVSGVSAQDLTYLPEGAIKLNSSGVLVVNGDTGMSSGFKSSLDSIIGLPRVIPIYTTVTGNGNNAMYTIVGFAGVRVLEVKLTGNPKYVKIQPTGTPMMSQVPSNSTGWQGKVYEPRLFR